MRVSILLAVALLNACDGYIRVEGTAYEWVGAGRNQSSLIVVDSSQSLPAGNLQPLPGVRLLLLHGTDYRGREPVDIVPRADGLFQEEAVSAHDGSFAMRAVTAPHEFHAVMRAQVVGYKPAFSTFVHDRRDHRAVIIMVREPD